jgi:hypothetical protein
LSGAVVDVLEVQPGEVWNKEAARLGGVAQDGDAMISGAMSRKGRVIHRAVVDDDGLDGTGSRWVREVRGSGSTAAQARRRNSS